MPKERSNIRVLIADDHAIFRDGLRKLLVRTKVFPLLAKHRMVRNV